MKSTNLILCPFCHENEIRNLLICTKQQANDSVAECPVHGLMDVVEYIDNHGLPRLINV